MGRTLLACCKQRLGAAKDVHVQRCVLFCRSFVAQLRMLAADGRVSGHDERKLYGGTCLMQLCSHAHISTQAITAVSDGLSEKNGHAPNPGLRSQSSVRQHHEAC